MAQLQATLQEGAIDALLRGLEEEENRLDQGLRYPSRSGDGTQDRAFGLKMWRPCDENDVRSHYCSSIA